MAERLGTHGLRVACVIFAIFLLFFGIILVVASIILGFEGETGELIAVLAFAAMLMGSGVVLIMARDHLAKLEEALYLANASSSSIPPALTPAPSVPVAPTSEPSSEQNLAEGSGKTEITVGSSTSSAVAEARELSGMIIRSKDVFATLKDLVRHETTGSSPTNLNHLSTMLQSTGLLDWYDSPASEGGMLSRNKHYWLRLDTSQLDDDAYDRVLAIEGALNLNQDTPHLSLLSYKDDRCLEGSLLLMRDMCDQQISPSPLFGEGHRCAYQNTDPNLTSGEWALRSTLVSAAECASTIYRVVYQLQANMGYNIVVIDLELPRPRCFEIMCQHPTDQVRIARSYAMRLATFMARHAFAAHEGVRRVVVNAHERFGPCCLSLDISHTTLEQLLAIARDERLETGFPTDDAIRVEFDSHGWFAPLTSGPFLPADDPLVYPTIRRTYPELIAAPAPKPLTRVTGAKTISDLGINEHAGRIATWDALDAHLGTTTEQAVQVLIRARNEAEDITVVEACSRAIQELVSGNCDPEDRERLARIFINGSALDRAVDQANALLDEEGSPNPEKAVRILSEALAPIDEMGAYLDDTDFVYRYFGSVAERIRHNLFVDEKGRTIRLVPDAYFNAHAQLSVALDELERFEESLYHAEICLRLAPTSTYAIMRKVRVLEHQSSIYEAEGLIRDNLLYATTPRDAAICHYRLAYMEWKLGREDIAVACYQRALTWDTEVNASALEELDDLLRLNDNLHRLDGDQVITTLEKAGIPLGCDAQARQQVLAAAVACIDANAFYTAQSLLGTVFAAESDDVVMGVYRSLKDWS